MKWQWREVKGFPIIGETPFPRLVPVGKAMISSVVLFKQGFNNKKRQMMDEHFIRGPSVAELSILLVGTY